MLNFYDVKPIDGFKISIDIPGSKSISNRALILAALSGKQVILENLLFSDDTKYMIEGLKILGNDINISEDKKTVIVNGLTNRNFGEKEIYVGNAGTAMRFLGSYIATGVGSITLTGNARMKERPIEDLVSALISLGVEVKYLEKTGFPPIKIVSKGVYANSVTIDTTKSSQYVSSLLLSASYFNNPLEIKLQGNTVSKPYIDMTLKMVEQFGGTITSKDNSFMIIPKKYNLKNYIVEGDMSSASYFLAAALIGNGTVTINNFFKDSIQGDRDFLNILCSIGLKIINFEDKEITVQGIKSYEGIDINLNDTPDVAQTLAIVGLFANSPTTIKDVENMRIKETDRISALNNEISKLGATFIEYQDGFKIIPKSNFEYSPADIETYDDHRMAMSFSLAGLRIPNIRILNPECVSKTFPDFFAQFEKIYGRFND